MPSQLETTVRWRWPVRGSRAGVMWRAARAETVQARAQAHAPRTARRPDTATDRAFIVSMI